MATAPGFAAVPRHTTASISSANTNRDGSGAITDLFVAGANGSRISHIDVVGVGNVSAGMVRIFINKNSAWTLLNEIAVSAVAPGPTVRGFRASLDLTSDADSVILENGEKLGVTTVNAEAFVVHAFGGDY